MTSQEDMLSRITYPSVTHISCSLTSSPLFACFAPCFLTACCLLVYPFSFFRPFVLTLEPFFLEVP
jgi:hypothetical protein